jgi:hypothetical protein
MNCPNSRPFLPCPELPRNGVISCSFPQCVHFDRIGEGCQGLHFESYLSRPCPDREDPEDERRCIHGDCSHYRALHNSISAGSDEECRGFHYDPYQMGIDVGQTDNDPTHLTVFVNNELVGRIDRASVSGGVVSSNDLPPVDPSRPITMSMTYSYGGVQLQDISMVSNPTDALTRWRGMVTDSTANPDGSIGVTVTLKQDCPTCDCRGWKEHEDAWKAIMTGGGAFYLLSMVYCPFCGQKMEKRTDAPGRSRFDILKDST